MSESKGRHIIIPIFVPHKGCPFDCIYCNQKAISGQMEEMTVEKMKAIIETFLSTASSEATIEIGFYGGSFTGIEIDKQTKLLEAANKYIVIGKVMGIRLSTRPDYIDRDILTNLKKHNVKIIELGVQSMSEEVLEKSCRGHSVNDVIMSSQLIKDFGFELGIQTMIGLPGDSREKDLYTAERVVALSPRLVRIYPTLVIKNTYLEKLYIEKKYKPLALKDAVDICADLLDVYEQHAIEVIRVGLQPTENITEGGDVLAGPFHPAFRQLVESRRMLKKIEVHIAERLLQDKEELVIYTHEGNKSNVIGHKRENIHYLIKKYGYRNVRVETHEESGTMTVL